MASASSSASPVLWRSHQSRRLIVAPIAGTTRDYVEEQVEISGVLCVLFDTAGLRESSDRIESIGIQRTRAIAARVDEVWYVYDVSVGFSELDEQNVAAFEQLVVVVANKCDLLSGERGEGSGERRERNGLQITVSALTGEGLDAIGEHVRDKVDRAAHEPLINLRQKDPLENARAALLNVLDAIEHDLPDDLLAVGLRAGAEHLGQVTGETATPDIIASCTWIKPNTRTIFCQRGGATPSDTGKETRWSSTPSAITTSSGLTAAELRIPTSFTPSNVGRAPIMGLWSTTSPSTIREPSPKRFT